MAGIGFELKKLFEGKGALGTIRAYGYTAVVCTGPMFLSILLLIGIRLLSVSRGAGGQVSDLLSAMVTYCIVGSLALSSIFSMVVTRYVSDMIYEETPQFILPSLYGSLALLLGVGGIGYGFFLGFSGIPRPYQALGFVLFSELTVVWTQMNYMTAIRDYRSVLALFACGVAAALLFGYAALGWLRLDMVTALVGAVIVGYGLIMTGFFTLLHRRFPRGEGGAFRFLGWLDRYPPLLCVGLFLTVGLFAHIVITWFSPIGTQVSGLFYGAPQYDIPAFAAFLSIMVSTVNFTVSVEVNFYPPYREYINLLNKGGALGDIRLAEDEMLLVMRREISYLAYRQFVVTVLFIVVGTPMLAGGNLGFTDTMLGTFRTLCVGYGLYAIANCMLLLQLYFSDNAGAFWTSAAFMAVGTAGTALLLGSSTVYYGFGFLGAGVVMYLVAWIRLWRYTSKLQHHMLSVQPVFQRPETGPFTRLGRWLDRRTRAATPRRAKASRSGAVKQRF